MARFAREAQLLAALNHPNIASIYGVEEAAARRQTARALILELVEGETLAERITRGPLPPDEALRVASQLGAALEAAHKRGIVHRDLKPANIKVSTDGVVKVLDFGLAKALDSQSKLSESPTLTTLGTHLGVVMGTPGYMSPEQARGHAVDGRTDIWAFGCVLFEMLTGRRTFDGQTMSDTIARILEREPDWAALPRATPPPVRDLLKRCLNKDPAGRPADPATVRAILNRARAARARPALSRVMAVVGAAGLAGALALAALWWVRSDRLTPTGASSWEQITSFPDSVTQPALSPDGSMLAFIRGEGTFATVGEAYLKRLPNGDPTPLTSDGLLKMDPVFSPDGNRLAYTVVGDRSLASGWDTWVVPVLRGGPRSWLQNASGLTWAGPSQVLFSEIKGGGQHMGIVTASDSRADPRELYFPSTGPGWHTDRPARPTDNGCSSSRWMNVACSPRAGSFHGPVARRVAWSARRRAAARTRRGRRTGGGCPSRQTPARDSTCGDSASPTASPSRSPPAGRPKRKDWPWRPTEPRSSPPLASRSAACGSTTRRESGRSRWRVMPSGRSFPQTGGRSASA